MNYIYDIVLNFNKDYYDFFEWKKKDKIINVKKIPAFRVSDEDLKFLKYNDIKVDKSFLDKICNLTFFYHKIDVNYKYMCLVSNSNESIGILFDNDGNLIKRSSMIFDEEEEVNEEIINEDITIIKYIKNDFKEIVFVSRGDKEKKDYLYKFLSALDIEKDGNILKYIYYDYYEKECSDVCFIKKDLIDKINNCFFDNDRLFELVKVLKKIKN